MYNGVGSHSLFQYIFLIQVSCLAVSSMVGEEYLQKGEHLVKKKNT